MNAITKINSNNMTDKGEELIEKNEFFRDLSELMENEKYTKFFDKYFKNMTESKITLVYMKLYNVLTGGGKEDISNFKGDQLLQLFVITICVFLIKSYIVQWSYNTIWPRILHNQSVSTRDFRPLSFTEAMVVTLLFMALL